MPFSRVDALRLVAQPASCPEKFIEACTDSPACTTGSARSSARSVQRFRHSSNRLGRVLPGSPKSSRICARDPVRYAERNLDDAHTKDRKGLSFNLLWLSRAIRFIIFLLSNLSPASTAFEWSRSGASRAIDSLLYSSGYIMEQAATVNRLCVQLLNDRVGPLSEQLRSIGELRREHHSAACEVVGLRNAALEACARAERLEQRLLDGARHKREQQRTAQCATFRRRQGSGS